MKRLLKAILLSALLVGVPNASRADIIVPGADGSDGALNCGTLQGNPDYPCGVPCATGGTYTIDLSAAASRDWNVPSPVRGKGVYDYQKWAVVFKYSCVDIPSNVTIKFKNHPSRAPVVWLVSGNVTVAGAVILRGSNGSTSESTYAEPGPGGFRGAARFYTWSAAGSAGFGPGGGERDHYYQAGGSYGTLGSQDSWVWGRRSKTYGNSAIIPLVGGSGGSSGYNWSPYGGGGAGGGAILVASTGTITISTAGAGIYATGGASDGSNNRYGGSGGAIRLIADTVQGAGQLRAYGGGWGGGYGRIRVEGNSVTLTDPGDPRYTLGSTGATAVLWPGDLGDAPSARIVSVGAQTVPTDPRASLDFPGADATVPSGGAQLAVIETRNVPLDWSIDLRMIPTQGWDQVIRPAYISGDETLATWNATLPLPSGFTVLQVRAYKPTATATASETADETEEGVETQSPNVERDEPTP